MSWCQLMTYWNVKMSVDDLLTTDLPDIFNTFDIVLITCYNCFFLTNCTEPGQPGLGLAGRMPVTLLLSSSPTPNPPLLLQPIGHMAQSKLGTIWWMIKLMEMLSGLVEPQYQVTEEMFYKLPVTNTENHPAANCLAPQSFKSFI